MIVQVIGSGDALSAPEQTRPGFTLFEQAERQARRLKQVSTLFGRLIRRAQAASAPICQWPSAAEDDASHAELRSRTRPQDLLAKAEGASKDNRVQDARRAADKTNTARKKQ